MIDLLVKNEREDINFRLPESLLEIDKEYIKSLTEHVMVSDYHCLIGIVYHETPSAIVLSVGQKKKNITAGVIPVFIKAGKYDDSSKFIAELSLMDKLIIPTTELNLGVHVAVPTNTLSLDYFIRKISQDKSNLYKRALGINKQAYFIDFKIIGNTSIIGGYNDNPKFIENNPYVTSTPADNTNKLILDN